MVGLFELNDSHNFSVIDDVEENF